MDFTTELLKYLQAYLVYCEVSRSGDNCILIVVRHSEQLELIAGNIDAILWPIIAEVPYKAEQVSFAITDSLNITKYSYIFDPYNIAIAEEC